MPRGYAACRHTWQCIPHPPWLRQLILKQNHTYQKFEKPNTKLVGICERGKKQKNKTKKNKKSGHQEIKLCFLCFLSSSFLMDSYILSINTCAIVHSYLHLRFKSNLKKSSSIHVYIIY